MLINCLRRKDYISEKTLSRMKNAILPIGMFSLAIAIVLHRFVPDNGPLAFLSGFLTGISVVANVWGIILMRSKWKRV